jgi:hypothetical protein
MTAPCMYCLDKAAEIARLTAQNEQSHNDVAQLQGRGIELAQENLRLLDEIEGVTREIRALRQDDGAVIAKLQGDNRRLRAALQRLVTDYQDVPDPTDADGQAVFEDARRELERKP